MTNYNRIVGYTDLLEKALMLKDRRVSPNMHVWLGLITMWLAV